MKFFIGLGVYRLDLRDCRSIKDKRRVVKSIVDRVGNGRTAAIREVGDPDYWKSARLAVVCISDSDSSARQHLAKTRGLMETVGVDVSEAGQYVFSDDDVVESILCQGE